jgi:putrescine aminotransferase
VGLANLAIMEQEQLPQRVRDDIGPYLARRYLEIAEHPLVGSAETCGFTAGLVLVKNKARRERFAENLSVGMICRGHCFRNGLIMRAVGDRMIIAPPLIMTRAQIDEMIASIIRCLDLTYADVKKNGWLA